MHPDKVRMTDAAELGAIDVFVFCRSGLGRIVGSTVH